MPMHWKGGVYAIRNKCNGKVYIGSASKSFKARWAIHRHELRRGDHHSRHLQGAWRKYGGDQFEFLVLERCAPETAVAREHVWLTKMRAAEREFGYNTAPIAGSPLGIRHAADSKTRVKTPEQTRKGTETRRRRGSYIPTEAVKERLRSMASWAARIRWDAVKASKGERSVPIQSGKSGLAAKYGAKLDGAVRKHALDDTNLGSPRIPGGITNGVAKLETCAFRQYGKDTTMKKADGTSAVGEYYFYARGVVVAPEYIATAQGQVKVAGLHTTFQVAGISPPVFDTKNKNGDITTQDQWIDEILKAMRSLARSKDDPKGVGFTEGMTVANLEELAATLQEAAPYFAFNTSEGNVTPAYPTPRIWENWYGAIPDYAPEETAPVQDETVAETRPPTRNGSTGGPKKTAKAAPEPEEGEGIAEDFDEFGDLASLATRADDDGDQDAREKLETMALAAGVEDAEIQGAASWAEVVEMIQAAGTAGETEEEAPEEEAAEPEGPATPVKGHVAMYTVLDPKTRRPVVDPKTKKPKKPVECEIVAVDPKTETVTLKSLDDGKTLYKNVKWDALS